MESEDPRLLLYKQEYLATVNLPLVCPQCGMSGVVSQTYSRFVPTETGKAFGLSENIIEVTHGLPSWRGNHSGCSYVWNSQ